MNWQSLKKYKTVLFIICFVLVGWRAFNVTTSNGKGRENTYGDAFSDRNVLSAVRFYHDSGFTKTYWLPVQQYEGPGDTDHYAYTHYPPLPDIMAGIYGEILNTTDESTLRIIPMLWAALWFFLIFKILEMLLKDKRQAFIGGAILVLSNYFIAWADNLHKHTLEELLKWLYVYCIYRYYNKEPQRKIWVVWMCLIFLLAINISFEPPTYLAVVSIGFSILYQRNIFTATTIFPGLSAIAGFMLHMWQNVLYFGSWKAAYDDMMAAFLLRTTGEETAGYTVSEIGDKSFNILDMAFEWFNRMERFYLIPGWAFIIFAFIALRHLYISNKKLFYIAIILLVASVSWSFAMMHHAYVHLFTTRQWGLFYGLVLGYGLPVYAGMVKNAFVQKKYTALIFHGVLILYCIAMAISQQVYGLYLKNGLLFGILE